jgi:hypothetical protein
MFIYTDKIKNHKKICKDLINEFEINPHKKIEKIKGASMTSLFLNSNEIFLKPYFEELKRIKNLYINKYPCIDQGQEPWNVWKIVKIQKYKPGEAYFGWHAEIKRIDSEELKRILVFSTFLNDVKEGGETEFLNQKIKVKAEQGKTIIFPPFWTHSHRGVIAPKETKYIITGWYVYEDE